MISGKCHLCGLEKQLSFEHVPPEKCFNSKNAKIYYGYEAILKQNLGKGKYKISQKGTGGFTLCESCNNNTGSWYADDYKEFCYQGAYLLSSYPYKDIDRYPFKIYPLRVIKQIFVMFASANPATFLDEHSKLRQFCLNKEQKELNKIYKIWICFNEGIAHRSVGGAQVMSLDREGAIFYSDLAFWPFGILMTIDDDPLDEGMLQINSFSNYGYNECVKVNLNLRRLNSVTTMPGVYVKPAIADKFNN